MRRRAREWHISLADVDGSATQLCSTTDPPLEQAGFCAPYAVRGTAEVEVHDENVSLAADRSPFRRSK
jgi:hypothetical protein